MRRRAWIVTAFTLMMGWAVPAYGLQAGITLDVHQDIYDPEFWPNDFHIRGYICSNGGIQPNLTNHIDDLFGVPPGMFTWTIQKLSADPSDCWYWFEATWSFPPGYGYIPYCEVLHFGLLFDVDAANVIIDVIGWWTRDGVAVGHLPEPTGCCQCMRYQPFQQECESPIDEATCDSYKPYWDVCTFHPDADCVYQGPVGSCVPGSGLRNRGFVPVIGFNVADTASPQLVTIGNGLLPPMPPLPPVPLPPPPINPPPWPPPGTELWIMQADVVPFPPGPPPDFSQLSEFGQQQLWPWVPVTHNGVPISSGPPLYWAPDSFFDIFLEMAPPPGAENLGVQSTFSIEPGGFLVARQRVQFLNNNQQVEERWFWEIHGAQANEACCFPNGTCQDILPFNCLQQGGIPQGQGSVCYPGLCLPQGACCYGAMAPLCVVTDQLTCQQQYNGQWKGVGTNCNDLNGNGIADICEEVQGPQACCLPDGTCQMLPVQACLQMLGRPMGVGTRCLGDLNGNGDDDLCEAKWYQMPDLSTNGIDIYASEPLILADDFLCTKRSLITDIHVWGSWFNDVLPPNGPAAVEFTLSIHADIPDPDGEGPLYSKPGQVLWFRHFPAFTFGAYTFQSQINEGWWDPRTPNYIFPGDHVCWMYYFQIPPTEAFCQEGNPENPIVYWLDVQARPLGGATPARFGWKTSINHWNDDAVWGQGIEPYPGPWNELRYPPQHPLHPQSIDLAFAVAGDRPCPQGCPTCLGDVNGDNLIDGRDIECFVDCFMAGPIPPYCVCPCADMSGNGIVEMADVPPFVNALLYNTGPCP